MSARKRQEKAARERMKQTGETFPKALREIKAAANRDRERAALDAFHAEDRSEEERR